MAGRAESISRLSGFPALISLAMSTRILKTFNIHERTSWAENLFNMLFAQFEDDKDYIGELTALLEDFTKMRQDYHDVMDTENWAEDERNRFNLFLDHIEIRLYRIIKNTKIIDSAGLREMVVPE